VARPAPLVLRGFPRSTPSSQRAPRLPGRAAVRAAIEAVVHRAHAGVGRVAHPALEPPGRARSARRRPRSSARAGRARGRTALPRDVSRTQGGSTEPAWTRHAGRGSGPWSATGRSRRTVRRPSTSRGRRPASGRGAGCGYRDTELCGSHGSDSRSLRAGRPRAARARRRRRAGAGWTSSKCRLRPVISGSALRPAASSTAGNSTHVERIKGTARGTSTHLAEDLGSWAGAGVPRPARRRKARPPWPGRRPRGTVLGGVITNRNEGQPWLRRRRGGS